MTEPDVARDWGPGGGKRARAVSRQVARGTKRQRTNRDYGWSRRASLGVVEKRNAAHDAKTRLDNLLK